MNVMKKRFLTKEERIFEKFNTTEKFWTKTIKENTKNLKIHPSNSVLNLSKSYRKKIERKEIFNLNK